MCRAAGVLVGVRRYVREAGRYWKIFVPRLRCARCGVSHPPLPAFTLAWRLDVAETIGSVAGEVVAGGGYGSARRRSGRGCRIRPPAAGSGPTKPSPSSPATSRSAPGGPATLKNPAVAARVRLPMTRIAASARS